MTEITHRIVETNGIRMHIAEQGTGPLVLLCHGFPECWYSWRHQLSALAEAGFHAVAPQPEQSLHSRRQQSHSRGDVRERITRRARQAADALFDPKQPVDKPSFSASLQPGDRSARKRRVLGISPAPQDRSEELKTPVRSSQQTTPEIPISQFARIRLHWCGMTVTQVAEPPLS